jgi:hypothetical protein
LKQVYKYIVLFVFIGALLLPAAQWARKGFEAPERSGLDGYFEQPKAPEYTLHAWFLGEFQAQLELTLQYEIGFREFFVRTRNQLDYSLFGKINAIDIYEGDDGYWFRQSEDHGIKGEDFVGVDVIEEKVRKLKEIQTHFDSLGTHVVVCIAPGKAWYHQEFIPESRMEHIGAHTNYDFYREQFDLKGINYIDMNAWFLQMKDTATIPLYSKGGVHWTMFGAFTGTDSLLNYIEETASIDLPGFYWDEMLAPEKPWGPETDVYNAANLLGDNDEMQLYHPMLKFEDSVGRTRPDVIVVGDSYWHFTLWHYIPQKAFSDRSTFWYYFKEIETNSLEKLGTTENFDLEMEYEGQDFIVLLFTPTNLGRFSYGFIDETYEMLNPTVKQNP